jgi:uncharacterized protein (DUF342 family)
MKLSFSCPHCGAHYQTPREHEGKSLSCAKCGKRFDIQFNENSPNSVTTGGDSLFIVADGQMLQTGKLALKLNYLTRDQLKSAVQKQQELKNSGEELLFGELLVREGFLTEVQRNYIISVQGLNKIRKSDDIFAGIVTQNEFATNEQIDESFRTQKRLFNKEHQSRSIADILSEEGAITEQQRDCAIDTQKRILQQISEKGITEPLAELISREGVITPEQLDNFQAGDTTELIETSLPQPFSIKVSGDKLKASLVIVKEATEAPSLEAIKEELAAQGISYNLIPDDEIELFLEGNPSPDETLILASGVAPGRSKDALIECKFDEDPLKIGQMKADGVVDFKDRGDIPQVKKGDLIAIKIPREQGENGTDIFNQKIEARKPDDTKMRCGKGVELSSNRNSATARVNGKPVRTPAGLIDVLPLLQIKGDIGLETGHIHFDGDIQVTGMVESGFKVTGGSLSVNELDGATIDVRGDLNVKGGIINSSVRVGGNLKAKYIRQSQINVVGDAAIASEVMQSSVEIGGGLLSEKCHLFASQIGAGGNITFHDIGSEASKPSTITLGSAAAYQAEKDILNSAIARQQQEIDSMKGDIEAFEQQNEALNIQIGEAAQRQDRAMVKKREAPDTAGIDEEVSSSEEALNTLFDSQDKIANDIQDLKAKQQEHLIEIEHIKSEQEALNSLIEKERQSQQYLHVKGALFEHTTIKAQRTALTIDATINKVSIFEEEYTDRNGIATWRMKVERLKI